MPPPSLPPTIPACDPHDGPASLQLIEDLTTHAGAIQRRVLGEILAMNAGTDYMRGFLGADADGRHAGELAPAFKERVPVVEYEDVKPYIERIANGAPSSLISSKTITELLTSSGTSGGQPKLMPSTEEELDRKTFLYNLLVPVMNKYVSGLDEGRCMYLLFVKPEIATPSGLVARPVLTSYYKSRHFRERPDSPYTRYTSPNEAILCPDSAQSMYAQLLCGLARRGEVLRVGAVFASAFLRAVKFLEGHWRALCGDIRAGRVDAARVTDPACREAVSRIVARPDPALADAIAAECAPASWRGIVRRLWPRTKYIDVIVTGSMAQYIPLLEFYGGGLPLVSTMYASSECYFGINLRPLDRPENVAYTLLPNMCYYEFIKVEKDGETVRDGKVVDLVDVEIGGYYELVVTTFTGLYRYRVGDILQVSGFHNAAPQFRFVHRRNVVLSVDTDKTSEDDLLRAVTAAKRLLAPLGAILSEYTAYADTASIPGHYVLFWELTPPPLPATAATSDDGATAEAEAVARVMAACCAEVEAGLDAVYRRCRSRDRSVGPLEIRVVSPGAFDALMDLCVSHGSSMNQYKTPRCIKHPDAIAVLEARVVGRFFSDTVPHWEPFQVDDAAAATATATDEADGAGATAAASLNEGAPA
ncbi:Indole-3-acetic acid-amido synthetase GH3.17 [Dichanthelium oligosanthes]|uniref:Indole-3-acetic acid-amido synthetase GH3.17 n=1 Tax=Dichanthelium oligosanthes TaxID=888268 RepID=A0A1E5UJU2_9POAL|nr:Indole-3-acetic acid-amido synthetase GH3.17 [Dichanthelium oligosanthes]